MGIEVRWAKDSDLPWVVEELRNFSEFHDSKYDLFLNEENTEAVMKITMKDHVLMVAEKDNTLMGFISGYFVPHPFNPELQTLCEQFWWVPEIHRKTRAGLLLLNNFIKFGKEAAQWVIMTIEEKSPVNENSLIKKGFRLHERSYLMEV